MRILIEEYHYRPEEILPLLKGAEINPKHVENDTMLSVDHVGYFYNSEIGDCVFILPKVLMDENGLVKGNITPRDLLVADKSDSAEKKELLQFVYGFSVWIYRAICVYREKNPDEDITISRNITQMGRGAKRERYTFLDVLLELLQFNRDNQDYLTFVIKNQHSGLNKINWTKTISKSQAVIHNGTPIYLDPVNKKRQVNFDEELLVIFYSILNHIHERYGFAVKLNAYFDLIKGERFKHYIDGYGKTRLRQIKYKYFDDRSLRIWDLCYAFFDTAYQISIHMDTKDYLLVHDFDRVFEDMVDELIGDRSLDHIKKQEDGKRLDHIYKYYGLTDHADKEEKVYYIGDSKYYRRGAKVSDESVAKQFTYARNLVQYNLNLFLDQKGEGYQQYRDEATEGYDIVPNFFISAKVEDIGSQGYSDSRVTPKKTDQDKTFHVSRHFENRLFDRDTILVAHYDVNFLFVLALYARNSQGEKTAWADKVREQFRKEIRNGLIQEYDFYGMRPKRDDIDETFFQPHFKEVIGKVFRPYGDKNLYSLALSKAAMSEEENKQVHELLDEYFYITKPLKSMGEDPREALDKLGQTKHVGSIFAENVLVGCVKNDEHLDWINAQDMYNVRLIGRDDRPGALMPTIDLMTVQHIVLYMLDESKTHVGKIIGEYALKDSNMAPLMYDRLSMKMNLNYPDPQSSMYLVYEIEPSADSLMKQEQWTAFIEAKLEKQDPRGQAIVIKSGEEI